MAIRHGLAGQYAKDKATKRFLRIMFILFAIVPWGFVAYGFVWGYFWYRWGALPALVPLVAVAALLWVAWRKLWPYVDQISRDRMRYLRGCQGEALVAWLLERELGEEWHVFNGIQVEDGCDIDHVVVGPGGLFCVSTKSQRGTFNGTIDGVLYNGRLPPSRSRPRARRARSASGLRGACRGKSRGSARCSPSHLATRTATRATATSGSSTRIP